MTASTLLSKLDQTILYGHWKIIVDLIFNWLIDVIGGNGATQIVNSTFKYDLKKTKGFIYINGGSVPVTSYRYANYIATIKVAG